MGSQELYKRKYELKVLELAELKQDNSELAKKLSEMKEKRAVLLKENLEVCAETKRFKEEIGRLQDMNLGMRQSLDILENVENNHKILKNNLTGAQKQINNLYLEGNEISEDLPLNLELYKAKNKEWTDKIANLKNRISEVNTRNQDELTNKEDQIQEMKEQIAKVTQLKGQKENDAMRLTDLIEEKKKDVEIKKASISALDIKLANSQRQLAKTKYIMKNSD